MSLPSSANCRSTHTISTYYIFLRSLQRFIERNSMIITTMGSMPQVQVAPQIDLAGLVPAPVTPFNLDGSVDYAAIQRLGSWLGSIPGVKGLVVLGHAGEGTFLTQ